MNKDVAQFIDQLHGISAELNQRAIEAETLVLSKDEIVKFSKLLVSSVTVLTAADKAFVRQEKISHVCVGLATVGFSLLIPVTWMLISLLYSGPRYSRTSVTVCEQTADDNLSSALGWPELQISAKVPKALATERVRILKQAYRISKALCKYDGSPKTP
jgi:hypothetical protein